MSLPLIARLSLNYMIAIPRNTYLLRVTISSRGADNGTFGAVGKGDLSIYLPNGTSKSCIILKDALYAPCMRVTLASISRLTQAGCRALFDGGICQILDPEQRLLGQVSVSNGLYKTQNSYGTAGAAQGTTMLTLEDLHARLAHIGVATIRDILAKGMVTSVHLDPNI